MKVARPIRLGVAGALGAMGSAVATVIAAREDVRLAALFDRPGSRGDGRHGLDLTTVQGALAECDVIIDFSTATASAELARLAAAASGPALVIGSTGFSSEEEIAVRAAAVRVAIVKSGNFSLGINVLAGLVRQAAERLGPADWDIEIIEAHHRRKRDAPSGTALMLGEGAARGRRARLADLALPPRQATGAERPRGAIGFSSVRGGGIVGEHSVVFAAEDEIVTLSHSARDRRLFARGAVEAAIWIAGRAPGLYSMGDVLGFAD
ncbi:MAG TPA: 4-hydroxy-tetrahydrodipicolinate reductase [Caulobacteraceae bacterium]|nr:4-hydroxy-tetrahydrodipicolinate reductase [Caulobacteraceae bacterium]